MRGNFVRANLAVVGLILLVECCAVVVTLHMAALLPALWPGHGAAVHQLTGQFARMLQYWATLLYVHALALAWVRRARSARSALLGFAGIVYLGCGFVFALTIASLAAFQHLPEDVKTLFLSTLLPIVAWLSSLLGCILFWRSLACRPAASLGKGAVPDQPTMLRMVPVGAPWNENWDSPRLISPPTLKCPAFVPLTLASLLLAALVTVLASWSAAHVLADWISRRTADRSWDFLAVLLYALPYLAVALAVLAAALVCGRRALRTGDPDLLWQAGLLAAAGGLQHLLLIGLPAVLGGILAVRAANRSTPGQPQTLCRAIGQSWGLWPAAIVSLLGIALLWAAS